MSQDFANIPTNNNATGQDFELVLSHLGYLAKKRS